MRRVLLSYTMFCIEQFTKLLLGFGGCEMAFHREPKIVPMPTRTPKLDEERPTPEDPSALPLPDTDEQSSSLAQINKWITLADIALGQGIGRDIA